jgi:hypothetical protein
MRRPATNRTALRRGEYSFPFAGKPASPACPAGDLLETFFGASAPTYGSGCHPDDRRQRLSTVCGLRSTVWSPVLWVTVAGSFFPSDLVRVAAGTLPLWSAALCCHLSAAALLGPPATGKGRINTRCYSHDRTMMDVATRRGLRANQLSREPPLKRGGSLGRGWLVVRRVGVFWLNVVCASAGPLPARFNSRGYPDSGASL